MRDNIHHDPVEDSFYFASWRRSIITVPLLLVLIIYPFYYAVMIPLLQIDLLIGNFIAWLFLGEVVGLLIGGLPLSVASLPIAALPMLWHSRIWVIAKIPLFVICMGITYFISFLLSFLSISLLDVFATPRTTIWWAGLWGFASQIQ